MLARLGLWSLIALLALGVMAWNGSRFVGTRQVPRAKDLSFLPTPAMARVMACGQATAAAKLRWIDSFAYFQLQLDRLDDRVAGDGRGGFERLYDTLIGLDPHYLPFYEHVVTNTGGVLGQHQVALAFLQRGLLEMPRNSRLWQLASAELAVHFRWSTANPTALDRWLEQWEAAEGDEDGRQLVRDWRRGLALSRAEGLDTLPYWLEQLRGTRPGTPMGDFVEGTVRELLAAHGAAVLTEVAPAGLLPNAPVEPDPQLVARRYPHGIPPWAPVDAAGALRSDPFGHPWIRDGGRVVSIGARQRDFQRQWRFVGQGIEAQAARLGRPPRDAAEAREWNGGQWEDPPYGGRWDFSQRLPVVVWPAPPAAPWPLR